MVYVPPVYPTTIPTEPDLVILFDDIDYYFGSYHNSFNKELRAVMTELGLLPKGSYDSVSARLDDIEARLTEMEG